MRNEEKCWVILGDEQREVSVPCITKDGAMRIVTRRLHQMKRVRYAKTSAHLEREAIKDDNNKEYCRRSCLKQVQDKVAWQQ